VHKSAIKLTNSKINNSVNYIRIHKILTINVDRTLTFNNVYYGAEQAIMI
jgi:hypothetical protein